MTAIVQHISANGARLAYVEQGQGAPIVFVHGYISDHRAWEGQREAIARHYRYIALSQRYFGREPWPDRGETFSLATHVGDLAAFIRALDVGPAHVVGWSYGAALGLALAAWRPELVKSLFAYEPGVASFVDDPVEAALAAEDRGKMVQAALRASKAGEFTEAVRLVFDHAHDRPGLFDTLTPDARSAFLDNRRTIPLLFGAPPPPPLGSAQLGEIAAPVAIARGELTRPFYRIVAEAARCCIPGSRLIVLPDGLHAAPVLSPELFNEAVFEFQRAIGDGETLA